MFPFSAEVDVTIETNQVAIDVTVLDVNDVTPKLEFGNNRGRLDDKYYIGVADDAMYGTSVFQIQVARRMWGPCSLMCTQNGIKHKAAIIV